MLNHNGCSLSYMRLVNQGRIQGGGGGGSWGSQGPPPPPNSTAIYKCKSSFRLGGSRSMKVAIPFFLGGGGGGGEGVKILGGALPRLPRTVKN